MVTYPIVAASGVADYSTGAAAVTGYALVVAFGVLYAFAVRTLVHAGPERLDGLLIAMSSVFVATVPFAREQAFFLCAVIISYAVVRIRRYAVPIVAAAVLACVVVPWVAWGEPGLIQAVMVVFTTLIVTAFVETVRVNHELVEARAEIARLASDAERNRIARDLHDLLGHSLTAITVKSGLARRLAGTDPARAAGEIGEVERLSRQVLTDVRAAVSGYRDVTLAGELARGRELLRASGVTADLPRCPRRIRSCSAGRSGRA
jgi:two-component system sensor histidine kinase DesK